MILGILGYGGSGKTLFAVLLANIANKTNKKIITNITSLKINHYDLDTQFLDIIDRKREIGYGYDKEKYVLIIDEIPQYLDSRESMRARNRDFSKIFYQIRKFRMDMIYTAQDIYSVDVRIRRITEKIILPEFNDHTNELTYSVFTNRDQYLFKNTIIIPTKLFEMYNTYEEIKGDIDIDRLLRKNKNKSKKNMVKIEDATIEDLKL
jgi:hypoxanthine phosphoribosyltransferase